MNIRQRLEEVLPEEYIDTWLGTPNAKFGGRRPSELIECGEFEPILRMLYYLESGQPS